MHEGERKADDFIAMARKMEEGVFVLATHSWHICETYSKGILEESEITKNIAMLKGILETLMDDGFEFRTMSEILQ